MISRRRFLIAAAGAGMSAGGLFYIRKVEPAWLDVTFHTLALPPGTWSGPPLRVLHLSDLHLSSSVPLALIEAAIARGLEAKPDLVCMTGDFVTLHERFDEVAYTTALARLAAAVPCFAVLGNHDGLGYNPTISQAHQVGRMLQRAGVELLHNAVATLTVRGRRVHVVGLGDVWNGECRPTRAFHDVKAERGEPILTLCHNPDAKDALLPHKWHALLSGHTHGGQFGLPWIAAALAPVRDKRFLSGAHPYAGRWLHITRGVGNLHGVRLFCRPEASVLEFV